MAVHTINSSNRWFLDLHKVDELTKESFKLGDRIVICSKCNKVHLKDSWNMLGGRCIQCKETTTKRTFSPDDFKKNKINIGSPISAEIQISKPVRVITPPPQKSNLWKGVVIAAGIILIIGILYSKNQNSSTTQQQSSVAQSQNTQQQTSTNQQQNTQQRPKADYPEGQRLDANGNGKPDFVVRNGRLIGTVSGRDFGPATIANFNSRKITEQDKANDWKWRDEGWTIDGQTASVMVFQSVIQNCTGFRLGLKVLTTNSASDFANSDLGLNWPIYVWSGDQVAITPANKVGEIKITQKDNWIYADITFSRRNVKWIMFQAPRRANGGWSGYSCNANISIIKT
ncbi:MAG: hypothetical protein LBH58_05385 [Tannerellaceae bacterium]|jgi:cytoskeletal protein RodZ|nr:hypothetical protein [Tannerellaceae bacterium]